MYQDVVAAVGFVVIERVEAGEPLTLGLCREVVAELGSTARPNSVYFQCRQWQAGISQNRRLSRR
jgi:hypothetical protein